MAAQNSLPSVRMYNGGPTSVTRNGTNGTMGKFHSLQVQHFH